MKRLCILGSTGSIGTQTLEVVDENPGEFEIVSLVAGTNTKLMEQQVRKYRPKSVCMWSEDAANDIKVRLKDIDIEVLHGMDGILELVTRDEVDVLVTAIVGMIGLRPTVEAIKKKKTIALANKETLVTAGHIIMPLASKMNVPILPVDSEHSAIFQSLNGEPKNRIKRILLTASGGPFRGKKLDELKHILPKDALKHPNWSMGRKITIDSATMVNKGLEVMEAKWLFGVDYDQVTVVVHPESILHSAVEYIDGAVIGQMGVPDMKLPIQYALFYPDRRVMNNNELDLFKLHSLTFEKPDFETFYGLRLAYEAGRIGGTMPTVFNAANEKAVSLFLDEKIGFLDIPEIISKCMNKHKVIKDASLDDVLAAENETYEFIKSNII